MTAARNNSDSPDFMVGTLERLAAKETDEGRAAILLALAHLARVSEKTSADVSDLKSRVKSLEERSGEIHELRATNDRQDREIGELKAALGGYEKQAKGAWWAASLLAGAIITLVGSAWAVFSFFFKP